MGAAPFSRRISRRGPQALSEEFATAIPALVVITAAAYLLYGPTPKLAEALARRSAPALPQAAVYPIDHVRSLVALPAFGVLGICTYIAGCTLVGLSPAAPFEGSSVGLLLMGAPLGVAEAAVSLILASAVISAAAPFRLRGLPRDAVTAEVSIVGRSGWIRLYDHVLQMRPWPLAALCIALPLVAEELLFRGLAVTLLRPQGAIAASVLTTMVFMGAQIGGMPSWFSSLPAVSGALVVGIAHGYLFWTVPTIAPLLVAHLTFFLFIVRR